MHVYQPVDLVLGLLMSLLGLPGVGHDLYRIITKQFRNRYDDWRSLTLSVWFMSDGPAHLSKALDPRHQESHRTGILTTVAVCVFCALVAASSIAWIVCRRQRSQLAG